MYGTTGDFNRSDGRAAHAKLGVGVCQVQLGNLNAAVKALEGIPGPDRASKLSMAAYLLADCLIRLAPTKAEDALRTGQFKIAEARKTIQDATNQWNQAGNDQNKKKLAEQAIGNDRNAMLQADDELANRANQFKNAIPTGEARARTSTRPS